ncbi:MAG: helix-turn-helix transcriptional regulator [Myxococcales bacterium]|nr:helix-turn-helix transcriptional regulator [Myxococcales bacterium]
MNVFWERGFSATSLSDLSEATGMNRPSLYAAFGDKRTLYLKALQSYSARMGRELAATLAADELERALTGFYYKMVEKFVSGAGEARGCMVASSASADAMNDADVRAVLNGSVERLDAALVERFRRAADEGLLSPRDVGRLGPLATAVLHSLSVRARAGDNRRALRKFARESVSLLLERAASRG